MNFSLLHAHSLPLFSHILRIPRIFLLRHIIAMVSSIHSYPGSALFMVVSLIIMTMLSSVIQNEKVFLEAALHELPTRTEAEVRAHCAWHSEYSALLEAKRLAIQQWKKNKQVALTACLLYMNVYSG